MLAFFWLLALLAELSPSQRSLRARVAAHESWARTSDPSARTAPARAAFKSRFEREVDPDGVLSEAERQRRAEHARTAYFTRLALRSSKARRKRATGKADDLEVPIQPDRFQPPDAAGAEAQTPAPAPDSTPGTASTKGRRHGRG